MSRTTLNHSDHLVWCKLTQPWVAVAGTAKRAGQKSRGGRALNALVSVTGLLLAGTGGGLMAQTLPTGGNIEAGAGSISQSGSTLTVTQGGDRLVANWQTFSVGQGDTVHFLQASSSAMAMNRVLGADVSVIQGAIHARGMVFLVNPNGVLFSSTAQVNVGGLVASTLNLSTADFMAGSYQFEAASDMAGASGAIVNHGNITAHGNAGTGGTVALIAGRITNTGVLTARQGHVVVGAGSKVLLDLGGPVRLQVQQGAIDALIEQGGAIQAPGGLVYLTAKAAGELTGTVINHTGVTEAQTLASGEKGQIYLMGGMDSDRIVVDGKLDASAPVGGDGGFIETSAHQVTIADSSSVTTLAPAGKTGLWLIDPVDFVISAGAGGQTSSGMGATTLASSLNTTDVTIQTDGSTGGNGDIFVNATVSKTATGPTSLTLKAHRDIVLASSVSINSTSGALNVTLNSDSDGSQSGAILLRNGANIATRGGHIVMGGGDDPLSKPAYGNATTTNGSGISLDSGNVSLNAGGGNISLTGHSTSNHRGGIAANSQASIITTGSGAITLKGTNSGGGDSAYGVGLDRTTISAHNGAINITGTLSPFSVWENAVVQRVGNRIESTGSGDINVTGIGGRGIFLGGWGVATVMGGNSATGNITLTANKIIIDDANYKFKSSGTLTLRPYTSGSSIGMAGGTGTMALSAAHFATNFVNGFSGITIGSASAGAVTVGGVVSTPDSLQVVSGANITINAASSLTSSQASGTLALAATGNFVNNGGAAAVTTTDAGATDRWIIYSTAPGSNTDGGLASGNTPVWRETLASLPPASVAAGNRFVFSAAEPAVIAPATPRAAAGTAAVPVLTASAQAAVRAAQATIALPVRQSGSPPELELQAVARNSADLAFPAGGLVVIDGGVRLPGLLQEE
ncbi:MAG: filamentous hemagglutinin N-terminal domain-containing protein [Polaromonas sp.]|nr:filamentous hemagglutinin N-terminal domain-containing protein [Polaromonas sp.]